MYCEDRRGWWHCRHLDGALYVSAGWIVVHSWKHIRFSICNDVDFTRAMQYRLLQGRAIQGQKCGTCCDYMPQFHWGCPQCAGRVLGQYLDLIGRLLLIGELPCCGDVRGRIRAPYIMILFGLF